MLVGQDIEHVGDEYITISEIGDRKAYLASYKLRIIGTFGLLATVAVVSFAALCSNTRNGGAMLARSLKMGGVPKFSWVRFFTPTPPGSDFESLGPGFCMDASGLQPKAYWFPSFDEPNCQDACRVASNCNGYVFRYGGAFDRSCILYMSGDMMWTGWTLSPNQGGGPAIARASGEVVGICKKKKGDPYTPVVATPANYNQVTPANLPNLQNTVMGDDNKQWFNYGMPYSERHMWSFCGKGYWFPMLDVRLVGKNHDRHEIMIKGGNVYNIHPETVEFDTLHNKYIARNAYYMRFPDVSRTRCFELCHGDVRCLAFNYGGARRNTDGGSCVPKGDIKKYMFLDAKYLKQRWCYLFDFIPSRKAPDVNFPVFQNGSPYNDFLIWFLKEVWPSVPSVKLNNGVPLNQSEVDWLRDFQGSHYGAGYDYMMDAG